MKNCEVATTLGSGEIMYFVLLPPFYNIGHYGKAITNLVLSGLKDVTGRGLCLCQCFFVSDSGSVAFAKASVSLENLLLEECNRFTLTRIIVALVNIKMKLKSLSLVKYMGVKDIDMEVSILSPCESFQSLVIQKCPGFGSASLAMINCEAGLVNVNLAGFWNLTNNIVSTLAWLYGGKLEVLNLDGCGKITNASLVVIANNFVVLNDLDVASLPSLQVLSLSGCFDISNKSAPFLMKLGQTLLGLNLQNCNSIGSNIMELLVEKLWRCDILA
ncbi:EIN3-binding F-box protein 1 [Glycine soja]|uniref:EIN3-binding F-box protein 1 n=1 Tax=Glycine soja TaxID=3848 RepID=A0A445G8Y1_GLYSO|nr:EIN3-binding F-box protein 1 [Glycine soja]